MNPFLLNLTPEQLRRAADIQEEIQALSSQLGELLNSNGAVISRSNLTAVAHPVRRKTGLRGVSQRKGFPFKTGSITQLSSVVVEPAGTEMPATPEPATVKEASPELPVVKKEPKPELSIEEVLAKVSAAIKENPEKVPSLHKYGVTDKKAYLEQAKALIPPANEWPAEFNAISIYRLGKNVAEDKRVCDGLKGMGVRVFGDLSLKVPELEKHIKSIQGCLLVLCQVRDAFAERAAQSGSVQAAA